MNSHRWDHATWTELAGLGLGQDRDSAVVALLPAGAIEVHGPHLPLGTDVVIARAAAEAALAGVRRHGFRPLVLPSLAYTAAPFAAGLPGTVSLRPATVAAVVADIAESLADQGVLALVIVNAHVDPAHLESLRRGIDAYDGPMPVVFPDITAKPWVWRMNDEFKSGACHAGRYETSVVMAAAPALVREPVRQALPANPASLSEAIRDGKATFEEAGVPNAYCGDPAAATVEEGVETIAALGGIVVDAVISCLSEAPDGGRPEAP